MKFVDWYLKIALVSAMIGGSMEFFMIKTGFCVRTLLLVLPFSVTIDDKVTVLESEKRAWEKSAEAQAIREALNPWRQRDQKEEKSS